MIVRNAFLYLQSLIFLKVIPLAKKVVIIIVPKIIKSKKDQIILSSNCIAIFKVRTKSPTDCKILDIILSIDTFLLYSNE